MRRITLVSCLSLAVVSSACTDGGAVLVILQNQVPDDSCTVSGNAGNLFRSRGFVDVSSPGGYLFTPVVQNVAIGDRDDPSEHLVTIQGGDVEIVFPEGFTGTEGIPDTAFNTLFSGAIHPDGGTTSFGFVVLTRNFLQGLKVTGNLAVNGSNFVTLVAKVSVYGEMDGGNVQSEVFNYPIDVCDSCLIDDFGPCDPTPDGYTGVSFACLGYIQDTLHQCCQDSAGRLRCPGPAGPIVTL